MTGLRSRVAFAAALGAILASSAVAAQGWYDDGYSHRWRHRAPAYEDDRNWRYGVDAGETDIAICPRGYRLGRSGQLCWPD